MKLFFIAITILLQGGAVSHTSKCSSSQESALLDGLRILNDPDCVSIKMRCYEEGHVYVQTDEQSIQLFGQPQVEKMNESATGGKKYIYWHIAQTERAFKKATRIYCGIFSEEFNGYGQLSQALKEVFGADFASKCDGNQKKLSQCGIKLDQCKNCKTQCEVELQNIAVLWNEVETICAEDVCRSVGTGNLKQTCQFEKIKNTVQFSWDKTTLENRIRTGDLTDRECFITNAKLLEAVVGYFNQKSCTKFELSCDQKTSQFQIKGCQMVVRLHKTSENKYHWVIKTNKQRLDRIRDQTCAKDLYSWKLRSELQGYFKFPTYTTFNTNTLPPMKFAASNEDYKQSLQSHNQSRNLKCKVLEKCPNPEQVCKQCQPPCPWNDYKLEPQQDKGIEPDCSAVMCGSFDVTGFWCIQGEVVQEIIVLPDTIKVLQTTQSVTDKLPKTVVFNKEATVYQSQNQYSFIQTQSFCDTDSDITESDDEGEKDQLLTRDDIDELFRNTQTTTFVVKLGHRNIDDSSNCDEEELKKLTVESKFKMPQQQKQYDTANFWQQIGSEKTKFEDNMAFSILLESGQKPMEIYADYAIFGQTYAKNSKHYNKFIATMLVKSFGEFKILCDSTKDPEEALSQLMWYLAPNEIKKIYDQDQPGLPLYNQIVCFIRKMETKSPLQLQVMLLYVFANEGLISDKLLRKLLRKQAI